MRHFALRDSPAGTRPALLFEIQIDFHDVRSGARVTDYGFWIGPLVEEADDPLWTEDMVCRTSPQDLMAVDGRDVVEWPESADPLMQGYLQRFYRISIWKNPGLGLYSETAETREEFAGRCRDAVRGQRSAQLRRLGEVFLHRFVELQGRAERIIEQQDWDDRLRATTLDGVTALFSRVREETSRWMADEDAPGEAQWRLPSLPEIEERLQELAADLHSGGRAIREEFEARALEIEPHEVRVTSHAVRIVSRNILWQPRVQ